MSSSSSSSSSSETESRKGETWGVWAKFIVNEIQRFSKEIESLHKEIKNLSKEFINRSEVSGEKSNVINTELIKVSADSKSILAEFNFKIDAIKSDLVLFERKISEIQETIDKHQEQLNTFSKFKTQVLTTTVIINSIIGILISIYASKI